MSMQQIYLLRVEGMVGQEGRDVEHDLEALPIRVDALAALRAIPHIQPAGVFGPALARDQPRQGDAEFPQRTMTLMRSPRILRNSSNAGLPCSALQ